MRKTGLVLLCTFVFMCTWGCSIFNPYEDTFSCPAREHGKCVSVEDAYNESLQGVDKPDDGQVRVSRRGRISKDISANKSQKGGDGTADTIEQAGTELTYQKKVFKKLSGLLDKPVTPLMIPPTVVRVLFLPYKDEDNRLYMSRYVYCIVDGAKWVMGNKLPEGIGANWEN
ncbi:MAG: type IV conjugative transfer system lipoprotein TraV [Deltaproteobacteria bacterium]|nr:type IV conjugative transfer system lipoprotein TraV [Deltaproteobacteria bacterium]